MNDIIENIFRDAQAGAGANSQEAREAIAMQIIESKGLPTFAIGMAEECRGLTGNEGLAWADAMVSAVHANLVAHKDLLGASESAKKRDRLYTDAFVQAAYECLRGGGAGNESDAAAAAQSIIDAG